MEQTYTLHLGDSFLNIAKRFYQVTDDNYQIVDELMEQTLAVLKEANSSFEDELPKDETLTLPEIDHIKRVFPRILANESDLKRHAIEVADLVNSDEELGVLFLADPFRVFFELGYDFSDSLRAKAEKHTFGYTKNQSELYDEIKTKFREEGILKGFDSVKLTPRLNQYITKPSAQQAFSTGTSSAGIYDTVVDINETAVERIAQIAYHEGVYPHRLNIPLKDIYGISAKEIVFDKPEVTFDTAIKDAVSVKMPFALIQDQSHKNGSIHIITSLKAVENVKGKPDHIGVTFENIQSLSVDGKELTTDVKSKLKVLLQSLFNVLIKSIPLSPLIKEAQKVNFVIEDFDFKIVNETNPKLIDSLITCINYAPNKNSGNLTQVNQLLKKDWGIMVSERVIKQQFSAWWNAKESDKFKRFNSDKMTNFKQLAIQNRLGEIFDANGDLKINSVDFKCENGYIYFTIDITLENAVLWIDLSAEISGKMKYSINNMSQMLVSIYDIDTTLSCWSKFIIAFFFTMIGLLGGAIIGAILGGVIGGVLGVSIGATIGVTVGSLIAVGGIITGAILPILTQAAINDQLNSINNQPLLPIKYDWQIPETNIIMKLLGEWVEINKGEIRIGGRFNLPSLPKPSCQLYTKVTSYKKDMVFPWIPNSSLKNGKSPLYVTNHIIDCKSMTNQHLEEPLIYEWTIDNKKIDADCNKLMISLNTSIGNIFKTESLKLDVSKNNLFPNIPLSGSISPGLILMKTIKGIKKDGTSSSPIIIKSVLGTPLSIVGNQTLIKVKITDVLGKTVESTTYHNLQIVGDYVYDSWQDNKHKYDQYHDPETLFPPIPDWEGLLGTPIPRPTPMPDVTSLESFRRHDLSANISGALVVLNDESFKTIHINKEQ